MLMHDTSLPVDQRLVDRRQQLASHAFFTFGKCQNAGFMGSDLTFVGRLEAMWMRLRYRA